MGFLKFVKNAASAATSAVGCCGEASHGIPGGCPCDFLDLESPTTADRQAEMNKKS
jgi:hypothetical protein